MQDILDQINRNLRALRREMQGLDAGDTINIEEGALDEETPDLTKPSDENTPRYFASGPNSVLVDNTDWEYLGFGIMAKTVNLRFTDDIDVAFASPHKRQSNIIPLKGTESPFTIGGDAGIDTAFMWVRQAETATDDPLLDIIAFR